LANFEPFEPDKLLMDITSKQKVPVVKSYGL